MTTAIVCTGCNAVETKLDGPRETWKCGGCGKVFYPLPAGAAPMLNQYNYSRFPKLSETLDKAASMRGKGT